MGLCIVWHSVDATSVASHESLRAPITVDNFVHWQSIPKTPILHKLGNIKRRNTYKGLVLCRHPRRGYPFSPPFLYPDQRTSKVTWYLPNAFNSAMGDSNRKKKNLFAQECTALYFYIHKNRCIVFWSSSSRRLCPDGNRRDTHGGNRLRLVLI